MGAVVVGALLVAHPASAEGDLRIEADATYQLNPDDSRLEVEVAFLLTNQKPSTTSGYVTTQYYFDSFAVYMPDEAADVVARDGGGRRLDHTDGTETDADGTAVRVVTIDFPRRIFYRGEQTIVLSFHLPGGEPRSDSTVRANPAYAAFPAWAWGDPGLSSVTIRIPAHFEVDYSGDRLATTAVDTYTVWSESVVDDPGEWGVFFTARNDDALVTETAVVAGLTVTVHSWPGDGIWAERVAGVVRRGLPELQAAVGLDFGDQTTLAIIEALDPTLLGYAGWYLTEEDLIEMGEDLDDHIILHEIAHLWFNTELFTERWINEGLAEEYADDAVESIDGDADPDLGRARRPFELPPIAVPLNRWEPPFVPPSEDDDVAQREDFGYNASFWLIKTLRDEIGDAAMQRVLAAAAGDLTAYQDGSDPETVDPTDGWRRFLDLLQELGGSQEAVALFREFVVSTEDRALLDERDAAREAYTELVAADTDWDTPWAVRRLLEEWRFALAADHIADAVAVIDRRDQVAEAAAGLGLDPPDELEQAYEDAATAEDLTTAITLGDTQVDSVTAVASARAAVDRSRGFFDTIGLIGEDPEAEYAEAATAFEAGEHHDAVAEAEEAVVLITAAGDVGRGRVLFTGGGLVLVGGASTGFVLWRRKRARAPHDRDLA